LDGAASSNSVEDVDGRLTAFMTTHGWEVMIVRPDFYVYGGAARLDGTASLIAEFLRDLNDAGLKAPADPGTRHSIHGRSI
jgi:hypothetical protein